MPKINLTQEELTKLLAALNDRVEPPPELAGKLFPSLMEKLGQEGKFDFFIKIDLSKYVNNLKGGGTATRQLRALQDLGFDTIIKDDFTFYIKHCYCIECLFTGEVVYHRRSFCDDASLGITVQRKQHDMRQ